MMFVDVSLRGCSSAVLRHLVFHFCPTIHTLNIIEVTAHNIEKTVHTNDVLFRILFTDGQGAVHLTVRSWKKTMT